MRRLTRRHVLQLTGGAALAGALAACAGATPAPSGEAAPGAEEVKAAPPAAGEQVELRYIKLAMDRDVEVYFTETAIPSFHEANPGYKVTVDMSDWDHLGEKLMTSFAGGLPVDLVETGSDWVGPYAARKQFLPLDDMIASDYQDEIEDFYADMVDISRYKGSLMGLPHILDIRTLCYRKDYFEEVGLDPEEGPDTWDDLVEYATKLVQYDGDNIKRAGYLMAAGDPTHATFEYWYLLVQNGTDVVVPWGSWDPNDVKVDSPESHEALQFLVDLINKHRVCPVTGMTTQNPDLNALAEGITGMSANGSAVVGNFKRYAPDRLEFLGVGKPTMKKERKHYACPNVHCIGVNTKDAEGAWKLLKHIVSKETITGMLSPENYTPPRRSIAAEAEYMQDPLLKAFQAIPENGWGTTTPQATEWPTLENIGHYVQAALRLEMTVEEALAKAAEDTRRKIAELVEATGA
ncbi:MAG: extracellular solute-binding protein [Anaerolineae bacterium]|nr:extracellular solute-binding protein [Anaerolineae bacterium]